MNSVQNRTLVTCPNGCEPFEADYFCFIRADQNPDLKQAVLGGEMNLVRCPACGTYFHYDKELIYLDSEKELLVFMFTKDSEEQQEQLRKRMQQDYQTVKESLLKNLKIDYPPVCIFGLDALKDLLENDEKVQVESEVVAATSVMAGFDVLRLKPSYARAHHFPYYIPAPAQVRCPNDLAVAAAKVLKSGLNSPLLLNVKDHMSQEEAVLPLVI